MFLIRGARATFPRRFALRCRRSILAVSHLLLDVRLSGGVRANDVGGLHGSKEAEGLAHRSVCAVGGGVGLRFRLLVKLHGGERSDEGDVVHGDGHSVGFHEAGFLRAVEALGAEFVVSEAAIKNARVSK